MPDWSWVKIEMQFDEAVRDRDLPRAWKCAGRIPKTNFSLDRAIYLTVLAAEEHNPRFEEMAQHLIVKAIEDADPPLLQVKKLADALAHLHDEELGRYAWSGLIRCAGRLRDNYRGLEVDFDSLAESLPP
jgi:hypothetical protein